MQLKNASGLAALVLIFGLASQALAQQSTPGARPGADETTAPMGPGAAGPPRAAPKQEATPFKGQILEQAADSHLASDLIGANVDASDRQKVGKVDDLIYKPDGGVEGLILSVGGFLGIGDRDVAIKLEDARIRDASGQMTVQVPVTAEELAKAPPFKTKAKIETEKKIEMQRQMQSQTPSPGQRPAR